MRHTEEQGVEIYGYVDSYQDGVVCGWVLNARKGGQHCVVEALLDDQIVAEAIADQFRTDLKEDGLGDGFSGFCLRLPDLLLPGRKVEIRERETGVVLEGAIVIQSGKHSLGGGRAIEKADRDAIAALTAANGTELEIFLALFDLDAIIWLREEKKAEGLIDVLAAYLEGACILRGPLFDDQDYRTLHQDTRESGTPALLHYALHGQKEGRLPTLLYRPVEPVPEKPEAPEEPEIKPEDDDVLPTASQFDGVVERIPRKPFGRDYLAFLAATSAEDWHPLVDATAIRLDPAFANSGNVEILRAIYADRIAPNALFDAGFYRKMCAARRIDIDRSALLHYMTTGWKMGVDPHPLFDGAFYRVDLKASAADLRDADPLTEFIGSNDGGKFPPSPFVDLHDLRQRLCEDGYDYRGDWQLVRDVFGNRGEWWPVHPHIYRLVVGFLSESDGLQALRKPAADFGDVSNLVASIRLGAAEPDQQEAAAADLTVSIVILNYNKPIFTILSAYSASQALDGISGEVIVVDNGSDPFSTELLYRYLCHTPRVRIMATRQNRYFGEGNNLALDQARGSCVLFLNNDAVIRRDTVQEMIGVLERETDVGAVAPVMIMPSGAVQEMGGSISGCGLTIQKGKFLPLDEFLLAYPDRGRLLDSDYASAACLLMRRSVIDEVGGFDLTFEPFYFEDADLCVRIRAHGHKTAVHSGVFAVHVENASTRDFLGDGMRELVGRQRRKFAARWLGVYEELERPEVARKSARFDIAEKYRILTPADVAPGYSGKPVAWIYTPYDIRIGGGERYILSLTRAISADYEAWLVTPGRMSKARLAMAMDDLDIPSCRLHAASLEETARWARPELYVAMGNEIEPPTPAYGVQNLFVCQFPFPIQHTGKFSIQRAHGYDAYIVYSAYAAATTRRMMDRYGVRGKPIHVIAPAVSLPPLSDREALAHRKSQPGLPMMALNIGRFTVHGHPKRQDVLVHMATLSPQLGLSLDFELYGGVGTETEDAALFTALAEKASKAGARMRANAGRQEIKNALERATFYVHPCGMGWYPGVAPERVEHFGITVVEAMAHGAIPIVYKWGGPAEIVAAAGVGDTFETMDDLWTVLRRRHAQPPGERREEIAAAAAAASRYDETHFAEAVRSLIMA